MHPENNLDIKDDAQIRRAYPVPVGHEHDDDDIDVGSVEDETVQGDEPIPQNLTPKSPVRIELEAQNELEEEQEIGDENVDEDISNGPDEDIPVEDNVVHRYSTRSKGPLQELPHVMDRPLECK